MPTPEPELLKVVGQIGGPTQAVAVQGDYAYVGVGLRLIVLDLTSPANPREVGATEPFGWYVEDVAVVGNTAFVAAGGAGLHIVDVSQPSRPAVLGSYDTPGYAESVTVAGKYAHVADGPDGLRVVDIGDLAHPTEAGQAFGAYYAFDVVVDGPHAYIAAAGAGLLVADVSDPTKPREIGSLDTPGYAYGVAVSGGAAYIADGWEGLRLVDVSDPSRPRDAGFHRTPGRAFGVAVAGSTAFVADAFGGLRIVDTSNAVQPIEIGAYETKGHAGRVALAGSMAYVAERDQGLRVVDVSNPGQPAQVGFYGPLGYADGIAVAGNHAYVAAGVYGLRVIDVADAAHPVQVGRYPTQGYATSVAVAGKYAYVATLGAGAEAFRVVDVSDPAHPVEVGVLQGAMGQPRDMVLEGGIVFIADEFGLRLLSVSDPSAPTQLGFIQLAEASQGKALSSAVGVAVRERLAYVAVEQAGLKIVDVSNPDRPTLAGIYPGVRFAQDVAIAGSYAYVADTVRLVVIDVSSLSQPREVASYDIPGFAESVTATGTAVYVAAGSTGISVIDVSDPGTPTLATTYNTPGYSQEVVVSGDRVFVADQDGGLLILEKPDSGRSRHLGDLQPPPSTIHQAAETALHDSPGLPASSPEDRPHLGGSSSPGTEPPNLGNTIPGPDSAVEPEARGTANVSGDATTCVVTSTADSGPSTFRWCLEYATKGAVISFDTAVFPPQSPATTTVASQLPWLTQGSITIDASNAGVILDGRNTPKGTNGLTISSDSNVVQGLQILRFPGTGVLIHGGGKDNTVGGDRTLGTGPMGQGNVISGNGLEGVSITGAGTVRNRVIGNYIGLDVTGSVPLSNRNGVEIGRGASYNRVGGSLRGERNVISENQDNQVTIWGVGSDENVVTGNLVGTDSTGTFALRLESQTERIPVGVHIHSGARNNEVGPGNVISGNQSGVLLYGEGTEDNNVFGNLIGTDVGGTVAISNSANGISMSAGARRNRIGGGLPGDRNIVSGNGGCGICVNGEAAENVITGNFIGVDATGKRALGNQGSGIFIGTSRNRVGGMDAGERNVISGNAVHAVHLVSGSSTRNVIVGNYVGLDAGGQVALGNGDHGIAMELGPYNNLVEKNVVVTTGRNAVLLNDPGTSYNTVVGNLIGTNASGTAALGGGQVAVLIGMGAGFNRIGGTAAKDRNVIVGGILLGRQGAPGNLVLGNYIGTDISGTVGIATMALGVTLGSGAQRPFIGGATEGERNVISGNVGGGVQVDPGVDYAFIAGNYIGTDAGGTARLGNRGAGLIIEGEHNFVQGNLVAYNGKCGLLIIAGEGNVIRRNSFVDNECNAADRGKHNQWDLDGKGNYWSDYKGKDANGDGVGDTPYPVAPNGVDRYPLMKPEEALR
ncbi:MAG: hypothetical protein HYY01_12775 [Chloroflexi bacterium]|nr:hypothetical protein [Chloroflexota bacterium]